MGTRHHQKVINKAGEVKLAQYGQWDGYPDYQGVNILKFLHSCNLEQYEANIDKLIPFNEENGAHLLKWEKSLNARKLTGEEERNLIKSNHEYFALTRDCGYEIHKLIEEEYVTLVNIFKDDEAKKWCEGFYTIDFQNNTFTSEFHGKSISYPLDNLPSEEEYLQYFEVVDEDEE